eukprot:391742_1
MADYIPFQSESELQSDDQRTNGAPMPHICKNVECITLDLSQQKKKPVQTQSLTLKKAKAMYCKHQMDQRQREQIEMSIHQSSKPHNTAPIDYSSSCWERRFCGKRCIPRALYGICLLLFVFLIGFSVYFIYYASPIVTDGTAFQNVLTKSECFLLKYDMVECSYDCYECENSAFCNKCNGPFCSACDAGSYTYYATATALCGANVTLESQLTYGDCPQQAHDVLPTGVSYTCYIPLTNGQCQYNGKHIFVFKDKDKSIIMAQHYLFMAYIGIALACLGCVTVQCRKCIKKLPCMN